ncbi:MAG: diaminopimelate decarboxylase [Ignavibacteriae bacterium]|nr:diaminopimelate decarboxylase [Ignavibacteriota bacterium]
MQAFEYRNNQLWCEGLILSDVAQRFGTPLYVYSKQSIVDHCRWIEKAFGSIDHLSCYAVKANANAEIVRIIACESLGADVGSKGELQLALRAGFLPEKITFSGVGKRDDEIEFALENNISAFNVESEQELHVISHIATRLGKTARILLRVNFDIPSKTHPYITTGQKHNKFGVECSQAKRILLQATTCSGIEVHGIHSHLGSQITDRETFVRAAHAVVNFVNELRSERDNIPIREINFGGGYGVQYHDYITHPLLPQDDHHGETGLTTVSLLEAVLPILSHLKCKIVIQPGRSVVAHAGVLLTKVLYKKRTTEKTFVIVDAGMNDLIRPSLYLSYHQIVPLHVSNRQHEVVDVVGPLCESSDFFALDRMMPVVERGEHLAVMCTGAYGYVLSSNYNGRPRPTEVLVDGNHYEVITERESIHHV